LIERDGSFGLVGALITDRDIFVGKRVGVITGGNVGLES
jgi:alkyl hydroperoxide reductase subunit AhpF